MREGWRGWGKLEDEGGERVEGSREDMRRAECVCVYLYSHAL